MGTLVLWGTPDVSFAVPLWVIILAILLGLLVLAMLTLAMWKVRAHHPAFLELVCLSNITLMGSCYSLSVVSLIGRGHQLAMTSPTRSS